MLVFLRPQFPLQDTGVCEASTTWSQNSLPAWGVGGGIRDALWPQCSWREPQRLFEGKKIRNQKQGRIKAPRASENSSWGLKHVPADEIFTNSSRKKKNGMVVVRRNLSWRGRWLILISGSQSVIPGPAGWASLASSFSRVAEMDYHKQVTSNDNFITSQFWGLKVKIKV